MTGEKQMGDHVNSGTPVCDMVFIYDTTIGNDWRIFDQYLAAGVNFVQGHPAGDDHNIAQAVQLIARMRRDIQQHPDLCRLVLTVDDVRRAKEEGKLGVSIQLEGFRCLERNLDMVEAYYSLGVRLCHPIFNITNSIGGGALDLEPVGLTRFGRKVIAEMNRVGMIVDGAHASDRSQLDMIECSTSPVVLTHHGVHAICPHPRNLRDAIIDTCASNGGVIGISGASFYLGGPPTPDLIFRHLDYVVQRVGCEHVGFGSDYYSKPSEMAAFINAGPMEWDGTDPNTWVDLDFSHPSNHRRVINLMQAAGYSSLDIEKISGGNWLRIAEQVWK
jgi:membrane dipeptidase